MAEVRAITAAGIGFGVVGLVCLSHALERGFAGGHPLDCFLRAAFAIALLTIAYGLSRRAPWAMRVYAGTAIVLVAVLSADGLTAGDSAVAVLVLAVVVGAILVALGTYLATALRRERPAGSESR